MTTSAASTQQITKQFRQIKSELSTTIRSITLFLGDVAISSKHRNDAIKQFRLANVHVSPYIVYGILVYLAIAIAITAIIVYMTQSNLSIVSTSVTLLIFFPISILVTLFALKILLRSFLGVRVFHRVQDMEQQLPEFLGEVALNLKAGQDLENAFSNAANENFGVLSQVIKEVSTQIDLGYDMERAMSEFSESYKSDLLEESFELIMISWKKGAQTPKLIDRIVSNMKETRNLREKVKASVASYKIFLGTVMLIISPAMMSLAFHVIDLIRSITTEVKQVTQSSVIPVTINAVRFNDIDFIWFSILALSIITISTSLIISFIDSGSIKAEMKELILYLIGSLASYGIFMFVFKGFFTFFQV